MWGDSPARWRGASTTCTDGAGFEEKAREAVRKLGSKRAKLYEELRTRFLQDGRRRRSNRRTRFSRRPRTSAWATANASTGTWRAAAR